MEGVAAVPATVAAEAAAPAVGVAAEVASSVAASATAAAVPVVEGASSVGASAVEATSGIAEAAAGAASELPSTGASLAGEAGTAVEGAGSVAEATGAADHPPVQDVAGLEDLVDATRGETVASEAVAAAANGGRNEMFQEAQPGAFSNRPIVGDEIISPTAIGVDEKNPDGSWNLKPARDRGWLSGIDSAWGREGVSPADKLNNIQEITNAAIAAGVPTDQISAHLAEMKISGINVGKEVPADGSAQGNATTEGADTTGEGNGTAQAEAPVGDATQPTETAEARAQKMQELKDKVRDGSATGDDIAELNRINFEDKRDAQNQKLRDRMLNGEPLTSHELWLLSNSPASIDDLEAQAPRAEGTEQPEVVALRAQVEKLSQQLEALNKVVEVMLKQQIAAETDPEKKTMLQMLLDILAAIGLSVVSEAGGLVRGSASDMAK